ncbi:DNA cytosine methyltransferase [uncultured Trichococcus sp.]|jgi:DNA (cytosine-5)-methyltransferase 1|uniref:DNA cytosine methyltransferase n=1 Tax=uncultured Trichococcus sp. TaxID=189665 RepID=UPI0029C65D1B|nr:DNA cytosine methyltransferase [uncultured Trichococcus sp.]
MYKAVSLFCGAGGADVGIRGDFEFNNKYYAKLPIEIVYGIDIDQKAINTYTHNFDSHEVVCGDICEVPSSSIPDHDILVGGFPCQSFSTVNPTKDPFDDRANLYKQMVRIAKDKQPKFVVAENVKGFMTLHKGKIFEKVKSEFADAGYNIHAELINSADYGVPQKRQRVFIVGVRKDLDTSFYFPEKTTENQWVPLSVAVPNLRIEEKKYYFSERAVEGMKKAKNNMKRGLYQNLDEPCLTITSHLAKVSLNSRDPVLLVEPENELYRRFTPREAARIQSFPDSFEFLGSEGDAYRQIGNAIPPVLAWHIFNSIMLTMGSNSMLNDVLQ